MRIALSGKMTSGKSLVATYLTDRYGFIELSFASKMKEIAAELFPHVKYEKDRWLLIQVGERLRELDANVWIRHVLPAIPVDSNVVISDVRFPREYETLKRLDFILVRMHVSRAEQLRLVKMTYPGMPTILMDDFSETALDNHPFDYTIDNDVRTLDEVYAQVDTLMRGAPLG